VVPSSLWLEREGLLVLYTMGFGTVTKVEAMDKERREMEARRSESVWFGNLGGRKQLLNLNYARVGSTCT
jgi:hypothetical protein